MQTISEPTQAGRQTLKEMAASLWDKDGLGDVILAIANGAVQVEQEIRSAALEGNIGATGEINVQGEVVQRLDTIGNNIFVDRLIKTGNVVAIGSEEMTDATIADRDDATGFLVQMDPVDGSSNIDVAAGIGSVFGIWHNDSPGPFQESSLLRPGNEQVAATYVIYGTSTILVAATRGSVQGFTLDNASGEFLLTHPDIRYPDKCEYYSANVGNFGDWGEPIRRAVTALQGQYTLRYIGSLVCDFHRNMLKGGIYLYPGDTTNVHGKLRLMYEANPLAYVAEQAGGAASTGAERILDVQPQRLHQQTPLIVGSRDVVEYTLAIIDR